MTVFYFAGSLMNVASSDMNPVGTGHMCTLDPSGEYKTYRLMWNPQTGEIFTRNTIARPCSDWQKPRRLGGCSEDGNTAELIRTMQTVGLAGSHVTARPPVPTFMAELADDKSVYFDTNDPFTQGYILEKLRTRSYSVDKDCVVEEVVVDKHTTFVSFNDGSCMELPATANLMATIVRPGFNLEAGTVIAETCQDYYMSWQGFVDKFGLEAAFASARKIISDSVVEVGDKWLIDIRLIPHRLRMSPTNGGQVSRVFEKPDENRKPVLVKNPVDRYNTLGSLNFRYNRFFR